MEYSDFSIYESNKFFFFFFTKHRNEHFYIIYYIYSDGEKYEKFDFLSSRIFSSLTS